MIRGLVTIALTLVVANGTAWAEWPTEGGDRGRIIAVTSLADDGPGSLRRALEQRMPRRIVFNVGGEIRLLSPLVVRHGQVTVDGETAPSPGISLIGDKMRIRTHDVVLRHLRFRVGELPGPKVSNRDGISIEAGADKRFVGNVLIDHCSVAWAVDENVTTWGAVANVRIYRTIVAEGLSHSVHQKGEHSMGLLIGTGARNVVVERNLFAHNRFRNPVVDAGASAVVVNNLIYNPGWSAFHVYRKDKAGPTIASVVGNVLIAGPDSRDAFNSFPKGANDGSRVYYADNLAVGADAFATDEKGGRGAFVDDRPIWFDWLDVLPAAAVEHDVLANVGARPDDPDETDRRIIAEVRARGGSIPDAPADPRLAVQRPLSEDNYAGE